MKYLGKPSTQIGIASKWYHTSIDFLIPYIEEVCKKKITQLHNVLTMITCVLCEHIIIIQQRCRRFDLSMNSFQGKMFSFVRTNTLFVNLVVKNSNIQYSRKEMLTAYCSSHSESMLMSK